MHTIFSRVLRRLRWYKARFQVNNPVVGRAVELLGDRVRMDGLTYSVQSPQISRGHKSTLAFGLHEMEERKLIRRWLPSETAVIEFGGGLGVVSCLTNRKLRDPSRHIVVEASPTMAVILERNRSLNNCKFRVLNRAIAYGEEHVFLTVGDEFVGGTINGQGERTVRVQTTTISEIMSDAGFEEVGIVCDIEGAELDMIQKEFPMLGERIRFLMIEMHPLLLGSDVVDDLVHQLTEHLGFSLKQRIGDSIFLSH